MSFTEILHKAIDTGHSIDTGQRIENRYGIFSEPSKTVEILPSQLTSAPTEISENKASFFTKEKEMVIRKFVFFTSLLYFLQYVYKVHKSA